MQRRRIITLAFVTVFASFLLSTAISIYSLHQLSLNNQAQLNKVLAAQIYDTISIELGEPTVIARTMSQDRFLIDVIERETEMSESEFTDIMQDYLYGMKNGLEYEAAFFVSEATKRYYGHNGLNKVIDPEHDSYDAWYTNFLNSNQPYALDVDNDELNEDAWTVFVNARVHNAKGKLLGVCGVGFHMVKSQKLFYELEKEYKVKISMITPDHLIQLSTDENEIESAYLDQIDTLQAYSNEYVYQDFGKGHYAVTKYLESLNWFLVVQSDGTPQTTPYLNVILINAALFGVIFVVLALAIWIIIRRTRDLANQSLKDQNTGLYNRRAFEEDKETILDRYGRDNFVYLIADVNGLKEANDVLGHSAGDEMIKGASDCLKQVLSKYGRIYRIGGDEFAAFLKLTPEELEEVKTKLDESFNAWQGEQVKELRVSCGYAPAREFPSETINELSRIADERMYAAKEQYYISSGKDRRRR